MLVSEVSVGAVLAKVSELPDPELDALDASSELIAVDELPIDSTEFVASVEGIGVVVTGAELDDEVGVDEVGVDEVGVDEVGVDEVGVDEVGVDEELEDGATGVPEVEDVADAVPVDGAGFVFGSVDCPQLTTADASATTGRSLDPADQRRLREAFEITFS